MSHPLLRALLLLGTLTLFGCPTPSPPSGALVCGAGGACPHGYLCAADNRCRLPLEKPDQGLADLGPAPDLFSTDLSVDPARVTKCEEYCTCMLMTCQSIPMAMYASTDDCTNDCIGNLSANLICRVTHCGLAKIGTPEIHCLHARGLSAAGVMPCQ